MKRLLFAAAVFSVLAGVVPAMAESFPPVNDSLPSIAGTAEDGQTLTADPGVWQGTQPISYVYQWLSCDGSGGGCLEIPGATSQAFGVGSGDVGSTLRVTVTATNDDGFDSATSGPTAVVQAAPPANTGLPIVTGTPAETQSLSVTDGTWSGTPPLTYQYQWVRCPTTGIPCVPIGGATTATYTLGQTDVGATIRASVTASNQANSTSATSSRTAVVSALSQPAGDPVVGAAGDIACDPAHKSFNNGLGTKSSCRQKYTSDLLVNTGLSGVLAVGDIQYECGGSQAFLRSYDLSWGRVKSMTHPIPGDHDYLVDGGTDCDTTGKAAGYFGYFGSAAGDPTKGYYSFTVGTWHVVALNTNCAKIGSCKAGSAEEKWLKADLAAHPTPCTLVYWHQPRFSSTKDYPKPAPFYQDLVNAGADVLLVGNQHYYERLAPLDNSGSYDPVAGVREFVVGTGGRSMQSLPATRRVGSEVLTKTFGILRLTLHANSYEWQFVPAAGQTFTDSGTTYCH
jgi:acid phosphatase type 7